MNNPQMTQMFRKTGLPLQEQICGNLRHLRMNRYFLPNEYE